MTNAYSYTPAIWLPLAAAIFLVTLSLYSWRRHSIAAARPLAVSAVLGGL